MNNSDVYRRSPPEHYSISPLSPPLPFPMGSVGVGVCLGVKCPNAELSAVARTSDPATIDRVAEDADAIMKNHCEPLWLEQQSLHAAVGGAERAGTCWPRRRRQAISSATKALERISRTRRPGGHRLYRTGPDRTVRKCKLPGKTR